MTGPEQEMAPLTTAEENILARSARLLAAEDPETFMDISARVRSTVRATTRRSRPVHAVFPSDPQDARGDSLVVREWVLVGELRQAVGALDGVVPTQIRVRLEADACSEVTVHVTASYGAVLRDVATEIREAVEECLVDVLGVEALPGGRAPVDITIDDVIG